MDLNELNEKHSDLVKKIQKEVEDRLEAKFAKEKKVLEDKFIKEKKDIEKEFADKLEEKGDRILTLEKKDDLRTERERTSYEDTIWSQKLAKSDIPERLFEKVRKHVSISKYVKDDVVDQEAFAKAVDDEIKDWEDKGAKSTVLGVGSINRESTEGDGLSADQMAADKKETDGLLTLAGQPPKENTA